MRPCAAQYDFNAQPYEQRCLGTVDFLVDIELLTHVDYAVLTFNSGLAHLVDTLRCLSALLTHAVSLHACGVGMRVAAACYSSPGSLDYVWSFYFFSRQPH